MGNRGIPDNNVGRTQSSWNDDPDIPKTYQTHSADYGQPGTKYEQPAIMPHDMSSEPCFCNLPQMTS